jgi:FkbM family methyltransferase
MTGATGNLYVGLAEYEDMGFVLHIVRPGDLFVDVGSNVGSYSILAASAGSDVIAFEPVHSTFQRLCRNVRLNSFAARVSCRNMALGASAGRLRMTAGADTMNHVATGDETSAETVEIAVDTLDQQLDGRVPSVIKVDVEGFEMQVLEGGQATVGNPGLMAVILELNGNGERYGVSDSELHARMEGLGFTACTYDPLRDCQDFRVWLGGCTLRCHGFDEAFAEDDGELGLGHGPLTRWHFPLFLRSVQDQVEELGGGIVAGEVASGPDGAAQLGIQGLDRIAGVDDPPDVVREGEERDDLGPGPPPALADGGIAGAPGTGLECAQRLFGRIGIGSAVDFLQGAGQPTAVLEGHEVHGVPQQVDDGVVEKALAP